MVPGPAELPEPAEWPVEDVLARPVGGRDLLRRRVESTPDRTGLADAESGERWTYADLDERVATASERLGVDSVPTGGRVGLLLGTRVAFAEVAFAAWRHDCSLVPLNLGLDDETLADQVRRAGVDRLVCSAANAATARAVAPADVPVVSVDDPGASASESAVAPSEQQTASARPTSQQPAASSQRSADSERLVLFTSGTTGRPKGVRLTAGNLAASANASAARLGVELDDRWLVCLPMYHMGGLAPLVRSTLYGTRTVVQPEFDPDETARVVEEYAVTCVSLVPTMLTRLLDAGWTPPDSLRFVLLGGGPVSPSLVERCEERDVPVCPTYGATETASQVATALPATAFSKPGTVGRPMDGVDVAVVDGDGERCSPGTTGEIVVDGPVVSPGYLDADATAEAFDDAGFHTGDLGHRDGDGDLRIEGRVDDLILTGGENVRPAAVADAVGDHPAVEDVVVLGVPDEEWGERVAALVVSPDQSLDEGDLQAYCRDSLAAYAVPKAVAFVDDLPRTASGTVDRARARERLSASNGRDATNSRD